ncbi:hypothetical protein [Methylobacterium sp. WSM2598]|nr:hypothetical protein [Methylobacterium sp. WSM2598]
MAEIGDGEAINRMAKPSTGWRSHQPDGEAINRMAKPSTGWRMRR